MVLAFGVDGDVVADAGVFVDDGVADGAVGPDSNVGHFGVVGDVFRLHFVASHHDDVFQSSVMADLGTIPDDATLGVHAVEGAAFTKDDVFHLAADELGGGGGRS